MATQMRYAVDPIASLFSSGATAHHLPLLVQPHPQAHQAHQAPQAPQVKVLQPQVPVPAPRLQFLLDGRIKDAMPTRTTTWADL
jgi:hypothetical protein